MRFNKIAFIIIILFLAIYVNLTINQYKFIKRGREFENKKRYVYAIDYYSYAILCYTPFSPFIKKAEKKILKIGDIFLKEKDLYGALFAYEILRASYFQVRSVYQPQNQLIELLNDKIAHIKSKILVEEGRVKDKKEAYDIQLKILKYNSFSPVVVEFISVFSFILWILIVFLYLIKLEKNRKIYAIFFSVTFFIWVVSLYL